MTTSLSDRLETKRDLINKICTITGCPSVTLGVCYKGDVIFKHEYGYRDLENKLPSNIDTIYGLASIGKTFVASAVGILVEEGKLSYDQPVCEILPSFNHVEEKVNQKLSIRHLLCHTAGLASSNYWWYGLYGEQLITKSDFLSFYNKFPSIVELNTTFIYDNWGYILLGHIIDHVTKQTCSSFIKERIFIPLGMNDSSFNLDTSKSNIAWPYAILDDRSAFKLPWPLTSDEHFSTPATSLRSSVYDVLKYTHAMIQCYNDQKTTGKTTTFDYVLKNVVSHMTGEIPRGAQSSKEKTYCHGLQKHVLPNTFDMTGCNSNFVHQLPTITPPNGEDVVVYTHNGSSAGFTSFMGMLPDYNTSLVVMVNSIGLSDPAGWIYQLLLETIIDTPFPNDYIVLVNEAVSNHTRCVDKLMNDLLQYKSDVSPSTNLAEYGGRYHSTMVPDFFIDMVFCNNPEPHLELLTQGLESQSWILKHYGKDSFWCPQTFNDMARKAQFTWVLDNLYPLQFHLNEDGHVLEFEWYDPHNIDDQSKFGQRGTFQRRHE